VRAIVSGRVLDREEGRMGKWGTKLRLAAVVLGVAITAAACSSQSPMIPAKAAPPGLPTFYTVPGNLANYAPGTLLKYEVVSDPQVLGTTYRVMYVSTNEQNEPVAVTGLVFVPPSAPPKGGYDVVSWAHGTNGMTNACAPSLDPASAVPGINELLAHDWVVTASDYQGEGTPPGLLAYLVGNLAARNTIDIVRAAHELPIRLSNDYLVWGHSEGGQTAMFAWHIAASYAPSLHLVGTVAGAPPSQFRYIYDFLKTSPYRFYLFMAAAGFHEAYGSAAPLSEVLDSQARSLLPLLRQGCYNYLQSHLDHYTLQQLVKVNPFDLPNWRKVIEENDPATLPANGVPLLIYQGGDDHQIPVVSTQLLAQHLCSEGQDLKRWVYPGQSHAGVIPVALPDIVHWMADRFAGRPSPGPYKPIGEPGVQVTTCG
jgi:pimeloyl-ACP methyl ester carboxylesterase